MTTDGNTAIPVSPTEESMKLADIFRKAADAVVAASSMPETIARLMSQVDSLQTELEQRNQHAQELDQTIHELREQRDAYHAERDQVRIDNDNYVRQIDEMHKDMTATNAELDAVKMERDHMRGERDDAQFRVLQLEEELAKHKATLADFHDKLAGFFPAPEPTPTPEPAMQSEHTPNPAPAPEMLPVIPADPEPEDDRPWWVKEQDRPNDPGF